ncbi:MAG: adenylyl-sulfate kinase [Acidobacteria bacterium]|nr:MAG: adenylyl-sulfate kinase [Acidobacteriota bacterium]
MSQQPKSKNITKITTDVTRKDRENMLGQQGVTLWFTGLSGSGKSTVAIEVDRVLTERGVACTVLDGDNVRHGLNNDLGFSPEDRNENIRRIGEVAKLFTEAGLVNLTAFISPYREDRDRNRKIQGNGDFIEVFVDAPLAICEERDTKGLYKKARAGIIPEFTGISAPYEEPAKAEIVLNTDDESVEQSAARVVTYLEEKGYVKQ